MASKNMYSWWWDSHISPKNSKWLQENLTDMDSKVKIMIKLIEVDEDTFARRAEMYYKKRPELMKLVEEFYRAYRALAERYDHATGVIRQAHKTMAEAFPNQVPSLVAGDDGPVVGSGNCDSGPRTPEIPPPAHAAFDHDELRDDAVRLSPSDSQSVGKTPVSAWDSSFQTGRNGRLLEEGRARKGLNFHELEDQERKPQNNGVCDPGAHTLSDSDRLGKSETDIQALKEALARLESEKETGLLQYQQSLARLSKLESEISRAQEDSKGLNQRASKAEAEVESLKGALARVESERETSLLKYQQCLERISNLESCISHAQEGAGLLNERACKAEDEAAALKEELAQLKAEKEADLAKYVEALEKISNLENRLSLAEDEVSRTSQRADEAEREVEQLKQAFGGLTEEKESVTLKYQACIEKIANLERELAFAQDEAELLRGKIEEGAEKLKGAEEQCLLLERSNRSAQLELDTLVKKVGLQDEEISEKQKELGRLWISVQEERMRFAETETAFQALKNLHSQMQEELRSLGADLQERVQLLNELEANNQHLKGEVQMVRDENKSLSDANESSAVSIQTMQDEILNLRQGKGQLEGELELQLDQRNALQQEIYCLKEELNDLNKKHCTVMGRVESIGLDPECLDSSVRELQNENCRLRETCGKSEAEISTLVEKLGVMERLIEKNAHLEKTLSELSSELEGAREKVRALEESFQSLMGEKSTILADKAALIHQLDKTTENLQKISERNTFLENSLSDANAELEVLRLKTKNLEASCQSLNEEKASLVDEKHTLTSQLETACLKLEELQKTHAELEQKYSGLKEERDSTLQIVEELQVALDNEKQAHATSTESSQKRLAAMETQIRALHKMSEQTSLELEEELDKAVNAQFEIFILRKSVHDLKEKNSSLLMTCETLYEASKFSEKLISSLELDNLDQQEEVRVLTDHIKRLRVGIVQLLKSLEIGQGSGFKDTHEYETALYQILSKVDDLKSTLSKAWDENQKLVIEKSVVLALFGSLKEELGDLKSVINSMRQDFKVGHDQLSSLQKNMQRLLQNNEELLLSVREGHQKEQVFAAEMENIRGKLTDLQEAYQSLQEENCTMADEKKFLMKTVGHLEEDKHGLEKENSLLVSEAVRLDNLSLILKTVVLEKRQESMYVKDLLHQTEEKLGEANAVKCAQKQQIVALSEKYNRQYEHCKQLEDSIYNLDAEVVRMRNQREETEKKVEGLNLELQTGRDEAKLWETVAGTFFSELQASSVREAMFKEKLSELTREYNILENLNYSEGMENVKLRDQIEDLDGQKFEMSARLAAYVPVIISLKNCVDSMENHTSLHVTPDQADIQETEDVENGPRVAANREVVQEPDCLVELQDIHMRIQAVEKAVIRLKRNAEEEYLDVSSKLEAATRQIEAIKSHGSSSRRGSNKSSRRFSQPEVTKDIMLDHVSDSSYGKVKGGKNSDTDDHTLELWETLEPSHSIDLKVGKTHKAEFDAVKEKKSRHHPSTSDPLLEKELGVDNQEIKRLVDSTRSEENNKNKLLERLASDVQKLTNLHITINDLKRKVESTEGSSKEIGVEYENVKQKLDESEKAILKLLDVSGKLMKNGEVCSSSFNGSSSTAADSSEVAASGRTRKISEQARRVSEKIGRLQLEVQKLQFLLLKLDDSKVGKGGTRITNTRVLLRDYLYSGARTPRRRRKAPGFCGCVQPPTSGD